MKDLEKVKEECDLKVKVALKENELESHIEGAGVCMHCYLGVRNRITCNPQPYDKDQKMDIGKPITIDQLGLLLCTFPADKDAEECGGVSKSFKNDYRLQLHTDYNSFPKLSCHWHTDGVQIRADVRMDEDTLKVIAQFVMESQRGMTSSESSTYMTCARPREIERVRIHGYEWCIGHIIHFQGGYEVLANSSAINTIIEAIKYNHEFATSDEDM